ncbi:Outer membrane efflux protein [Caloramator quimbayensis]|uniref:Outer membrane efflux protein n=1 Tax=Caloramator quimbayensis TaxID=1147123 RepID=A0A1T4WJ49_9CLOT|nr:TolC family protein [Caloramator quimbayensis]SKA76671.1 Outer membrane efflux protein [Caloramator quimbayensis]
MKKHKLLLLSLIFLVIFSSTAYAESSTLFLNNIIDDAIENSITLKSLSNKVKSLEKSKSDAEEASKDAAQRLDTNEALKDLLKNYSSLSPAEKMQVTMLIRMHIIMTIDDKLQFTKIKELSVPNADYAILQNKNNMEIAKNSSILSISQQFNTILNMQDSIKLQNNNIKILEDRLNTAKIQYDNGLISNKDYKTLESSLKKSKLELLKMQNNMNSLVITLNQAINKPLLTKYDEFSDSGMTPYLDIKSLDEYINTALTYRSEIICNQKYYDIKKREYEITYEVYPSDLNDNTQQAKYDMEDAQNKLEQSKEDIKIEITTLYKDIEKNIQDINNYQKKYDAAKYDNEIAKKKYSFGLISRLDVENSNLNLLQAQIQLNQAKRTLYINELKLNFACGIGPAA